MRIATTLLYAADHVLNSTQENGSPLLLAMIPRASFKPPLFSSIHRRKQSPSPHAPNPERSLRHGSHNRIGRPKGRTGIPIFKGREPSRKELLQESCMEGRRRMCERAKLSCYTILNRQMLGSGKKEILGYKESTLRQAGRTPTPFISVDLRLTL